MKNDHDPLSSYKTASLVATYEELHQVPATERITYYYGDYGGHFFKYGTGENAIRAAYKKALSAIRMSSDEFQQSDDFIHRGGIIARMRDCMLDSNTRLRDVFEDWPGADLVSVIHEDGTDHSVTIEALAKLTDTGRDNFATLLGAKVEMIRATDSGFEVVISGVDAQELERFRDAYDAHERAEQAMGPVME